MSENHPSSSTNTGPSSANYPRRTTPAQDPAASLPSGPTQCLPAPGSQRTSERLARCVNAQVRCPTSMPCEGTTAPPSDVVRTRYTAEEVRARRLNRVPDWAGWEPYQAGGGYHHDQPLMNLDSVLNRLQGFDERQGTGDLVDGDGTIPMIDSRQEIQTMGTVVGLPVNPSIGFQTLGESGFHQATTSPLTPQASPGNALPLILGLLYLVARAFGVGSRRGTLSGASDKHPRTGR